MDDTEPRLPDDDEPVAMTMNERTVWAYLLTVIVTSGVYLTLMLIRLVDEPVGQIAWVGPMLWTIGASVLGTVVVTAVLAIGRSIGSGQLGPSGRAPVAFTELDPVSDARDKDIDLVGDRALVGVLGAGFVGALVLAMIGADTFWIGNLLFVFGTIGAIVETTTKIRLYRRGF
ncbi:MAG: hypothetical protein KJ548_00955 [Actinobacteria bacterium]|nr:hypothetical protein [Actinomycetota bacterium]MCG2800329.1 hypothetical protein [Cellulomonas sp.]